MTFFLPNGECANWMTNIRHKLSAVKVTNVDWAECESACKFIPSLGSIPAGFHKDTGKMQLNPIQVYVRPNQIVPSCVCQTPEINARWVGYSKCEKRYVNDFKYWGPAQSSGNLWLSRNLTSYNIMDTFGLADMAVYSDVIIPPVQNRYMLLTKRFWICGSNAYLWLPAFWSGCCYLGHVSAPLTFIGKAEALVKKQTPIRTKRDNPKFQEYRPHLRISSEVKTLEGLFPWYGTVHNAYLIDNVSLELESFANYAIEGFHLLTDEMKSLKLVTLQNRAALDYLLAKDGGVCAVIEKQCCTFIPDIKDNMTDVIQHMTVLKEEMFRNTEEVSPDEPKTDVFSWIGNQIGHSFWNILKDFGSAVALFLAAVMLLYLIVRLSMWFVIAVINPPKKARVETGSVYQEVGVRGQNEIYHSIA